MKTPESPLDLDSLLEPSIEPAPVPPLAPPPPIGTSVTQAISQPMESRWDTDEILDIPRPSTAGESHHDPLAVEDLLATTPIESYGAVESVLTEPFPATDTSAAGLWGNATDEAGEIVADQPTPFDGSPHIQFNNGDYADAAPELQPEPAPERPSVFAQDSYTRSPANTYVMATPDSNNKGRLAKIFLAAAVVFALLGVGYFALSGLIKDWLGARKSQQASVTPGGATQTATGNPGATPSLGTKAATDANSKNTSASPNASATVAASTKPSVSATATPASANQSAASKPTPTPAPPQTGASGHAVGSGDGSLTIQLGAYKSSGEAQQRVTKLKAAGIEGRVVKAEVPGKGTWYRVQSGRFTNEAEASKHAGDLRAKGVAQDFIVTGYQNQ